MFFMSSNESQFPPRFEEAVELLYTKTKISTSKFIVECEASILSCEPKTYSLVETGKLKNRRGLAAEINLQNNWRFS